LTRIFLAATIKMCPGGAGRGAVDTDRGDAVGMR
jgi:hypothetical protein